MNRKLSYLARKGVIMLSTWFTRAAVAAFIGVATTGAAASSASSPAIRAKTTVVVRGTYRPGALTGAAYRVIDRGTPGGKVVLDVPIAFNNTGQIVGLANDGYRPADPLKQGVCEIYDGSRFRTLSVTEVTCIPAGMNDEVHGTLEVVAVASTPYFGNVATIFVDSPATHAIVAHDFINNSASAAFGINGFGEAIGLAYYDPITPFEGSPPFIFYADGSQKLLQPTCTTQKRGCGVLDPTASYFPPDFSLLCPFGGCRITNSGSTLLYDEATGHYEVLYRGGAYLDLPQYIVPSQYYPIMINNAGKVLFAEENFPGDVVTTSVQQVGANHATQVPAISGSSCQDYVPLSMNNKGEVLGYTKTCPSNDATFFTYDSRNGTQDLKTLIPVGSPPIQAYAVNDNGEILISTNTNFPYHWGILRPTSGK